MEKELERIGFERGYYHGYNMQNEPVPDPNFGTHHLVDVPGENCLNMKFGRQRKDGTKYFVGPYIKEINHYSPPFQVLGWEFYLHHIPSGTMVMQSPTTEVVTYLMKNTEDALIADFNFNEEDLLNLDRGARKLGEFNLLKNETLEVLFCSQAGDEGSSAGIPSKSEKGLYYGIDLQNFLEFDSKGNVMFSPSIDMSCGCQHSRKQKKKYTDFQRRPIEICHHLSTALELLSMVPPITKDVEINVQRPKGQQLIESGGIKSILNIFEPVQSDRYILREGIKWRYFDTASTGKRVTKAMFDLYALDIYGWEKVLHPVLARKMMENMLPEYERVERTAFWFGEPVFRNRINVPLPIARLNDIELGFMPHRGLWQ